MHWGTIKPAIKTLIGNLSGLTTVWQDEPRPFAFTPPSTPAICIISLGAVRELGTGTVIREQDLNQATGQEMADEHRSDKVVTLTVKVESEIQTDTGDALEYVERVRQRIKFRGSLEALRDVNLAINQIGQTVDLGESRDSRRRAIAALDVILNVKTTIQDPNRYPYIGSVDVAGTVDGVPGNLHVET